MLCFQLTVAMLLAVALTEGVAVDTDTDFTHAASGGHWHRQFRRSVPRTCSRGSKLSDATALAMCKAAGIWISSSSKRYGCRDPGFTSLEQVRCETVLGLLRFRQVSGCTDIVITGGTERGHSGGTQSHYNGYKVDIALTDCVNQHVVNKFRLKYNRSDRAKVYADGNNEYALEKNHWDILYF